jgi:hypothetical protein
VSNAAGVEVVIVDAPLLGRRTQIDPSGALSLDWWRSVDNEEPCPRARIMSSCCINRLPMS